MNVQNENWESQPQNLQHRFTLQTFVSKSVSVTEIVFCLRMMKLKKMTRI